MNARIYDPIVGTFFSPDPLQDATPHFSSYTYCANNPINYTDPTGMIFDEGSNPFLFELYDDYKSINALLETNKYNPTMSDLYEKWNEYQDIMSEISTMDLSNQIYRLRSRNEAGGKIMMNTDGSILMTGKTFSNRIHELKHGYQYDIKELSFGPTGEGGVLHDLFDEMAAYERESIFDPDAKKFLSLDVLRRYYRDAGNKPLNANSSIYDIFHERGDSGWQNFINRNTIFSQNTKFTDLLPNGQRTYERIGDRIKLP